MRRRFLLIAVATLPGLLGNADPADRIVACTLASPDGKLVFTLERHTDSGQSPATEVRSSRAARWALNWTVMA